MLLTDDVTTDDDDEHFSLISQLGRSGTNCLISISSGFGAKEKNCCF